ncbi:hypothetical protein ACFLVQ_00865 [Chloroflexota bacterium]
MERFVLAGKAKTVFQIIELMAKGEEVERKQETDNEKMKLIVGNTIQLWPSTK